MTSVVDLREVKEELAVSLKNADILTITQRGVTTATDTGTFAADSTHLIAVSTVRNIRSITVGGSPLAFGTDYSVDYDYDDAGTIKCQITFVAAQTGAYSIPYDFGADERIFVGFPKNTRKISDFPVIGMDIIGADSNDIEITGSTERLNLTLTIIVYDKKVEDIEGYIKSIKEHIIANKKSFFHLAYIRLLAMGNIGLFSEGNKQKVFQRNIDYLAPFNYETV